MRPRRITTLGPWPLYFRLFSSLALPKSLHSSRAAPTTSGCIETSGLFFLPVPYPWHSSVPLSRVRRISIQRLTYPTKRHRNSVERDAIRFLINATIRPLIYFSRILKLFSSFLIDNTRIHIYICICMYIYIINVVVCCSLRGRRHIVDVALLFFQFPNFLSIS